MNFYLKEFSLKNFGAALLIGTIAFGLSQATYASNYKKTQSYKFAYSCGIESLKDGIATPDVGSLVSSCVGNSHDPSKVEIQGFKDAIAATRGKSQNNEAVPCIFAYGVYNANGSRVDDFAEGPQKVTTMNKVARLWPGREFSIYDAQGSRISNEIINQWFRVIKQGQYGIEEIGLTEQARKTCSRKQIG